MKREETLSEGWYSFSRGCYILKLGRGRELRVFNNSWRCVSKGVHYVRDIASVTCRGRIDDIKREAEAFARYRGYL